MSTLSTDRRTMLKFGALAAAPVAALAPGAVMAAQPAPDPAGDQAAVAALMREAVRRFNAQGTQGCTALAACAGAIALPAGLTALRLDGAAEPDVAVSEDGASARWTQSVTVVRDTAFDGDSTIERMARFQGQPAARSEAPARLAAELSRTAQGWVIGRLQLA